MSRRTAQIEALRERRELAALKIETARMEHRARVFAKYDATESSKARRQAVPERTDEGHIFDQTRRMKGVNIGRDLERNYSPAKSLFHQLRVNVVGSLGKLQVNVENGKEATDWFNEVWSKDCDFRDDCDWSTLLQLIVTSVPREGDCLAVFDDNLLDDTGKLLMFEADQIADFADDALRTKPIANWHSQHNGIARDKWGRVLGYCTTSKHGLQSITADDDPTFWRRNEDARFVANPWRLNQGRGVPSIITAATNFIDLYEILASELASTKRAAKQYAYVQRRDGMTDPDDPTQHPVRLPENTGKTDAEVALEGANETTATGASNYEKLEALTGGLTDYIAPEDQVIIPDMKHPNSQIAAFIEAVQGYGGASMGFARAYTMLRADSSYTAFRGDMIMTWVTIHWLQKWLERRVCDWVARKAVAWAMRRRVIAPVAAGWERSLSWTWPQMPEVDELDAQNSIAMALKNGTTDYSQLLGPDWRRRLQAYAEQIEFVRKALLPLGVLEGKSGGQLDNPKKDASDKDAAQPKEATK